MNGTEKLLVIYNHLGQQAGNNRIKVVMQHIQKRAVAIDLVYQEVLALLTIQVVILDQKMNDMLDHAVDEL